MSADNIKWQVNRGVQASNLTPAARLIMFVLSDMANAETGMIPLKQTPSLADLARKTGLGESTVKEQLAVLERLKWVERKRPNASERARHASTYYRVMVGEPGEERTPKKRKPRARSKPSDGGVEGQDVAIEETDENGSDSQEQAIGEGREIALESESEGQELADRGPGANDSRARSWPSYLKDDDLNDLNDRVAANAAAHPADAGLSKPETANQRANRLAKIYTDQVKLSNFMAVRGVVAKAIQGECTDQQISDGLNKLIQENRGVSAEQLRIAIFGPPKNGSSGYQPYRNPTDPDAYGGPIR